MAYVIGFGGFQMEILRYQFPDLNDYWDGNWLVVKVSCEADSERVAFRDHCIRTDEIARFGGELSTLMMRNSDQATMDTMEPYLKWQICRTSHEKFVATVRLKPRAETAEFAFELGDKDIVSLFDQICSAVSAFPVRGSQ